MIWMTIRYLWRQVRAQNEKIYDLESQLYDLRLLSVETAPRKLRRKRT